MDFSQDDIKRRWESHRQGNGNGNIVLAIKLRVRDCFCRDHHAPVANRLIDDYLMRHRLDPAYCEYVEHESGPEILVHLQVVSAGVALAAGSMVLLAAIVNLVTAIVNARSAGERKGDSQHGPLVIVVRGMSPDGVFFEEQVLEADIHAPPTEMAVQNTLTDAIKLIAEDRVKRERAKTGKQRATSKKTERAKRKAGG